jgi:hypothetical protein
LISIFGGSAFFTSGTNSSCVLRTAATLNVLVIGSYPAISMITVFAPFESLPDHGVLPTRQVLSLM